MPYDLQNNAERRSNTELVKRYGVETKKVSDSKNQGDWFLISEYKNRSISHF